MANLKGRKVALVGLERDDMFALSAALESAGAEWQAFGATDPSALARVDVVIAGAAAANSLSAFAGPLLIVAPIASLNDAPIDSERPRDFSVAPPLRPDEVVLRAAHLLEQAPKKRAATASPVVVAADDDPTTTSIVRAVVTRNGMICHTAGDGKKALDIARSTDPSVVILDVNMPFLDGFQVLTALRADPRTESVPVVMLTSMQQEADVVRGFSLGADDYIVKPFNPMELLARIRRLVKKQS